VAPASSCLRCYPSGVRFVRACPRCGAVLRELRCAKHRSVPRWLVVDLVSGAVLATASVGRVTLGPLLLSATFFEAYEREAALPKTPHPRAA
jgi:hypothetical protein